MPDTPGTVTGPINAAIAAPASTAVTCTDESTQQLTLFDKDDAGVAVVSLDMIGEEGTTAGEYTTHIVSTAGGLVATKLFIYLRFTVNGLLRVNLSDQQAFTSLDWDLAVRRYVLRINSGVSGAPKPISPEARASTCLTPAASALPPPRSRASGRTPSVCR